MNTANAVPVPVRSHTPEVVLGVAGAVTAVGAALLVITGYRADASPMPLPGWQHTLPWAILAVGLVATVVVLVYLGCRRRTWAWIALGVLLVPVVLAALTFLTISLADL